MPSTSFLIIIITCNYHQLLPTHITQKPLEDFISVALPFYGHSITSSLQFNFYWDFFPVLHNMWVCLWLISRRRRHVSRESSTRRKKWLIYKFTSHPFQMSHFELLWLNWFRFWRGFTHCEWLRWTRVFISIFENITIWFMGDFFLKTTILKPLSMSSKLLFFCLFF